MKGRDRDESNMTCSFCVGEQETTEHLIIECSKYEEQRRKFISAVLSVIGVEEWQGKLGSG